MTRVLLATLTGGNVSEDYHGSIIDLIENPLNDVKVKTVRARGGGMSVAHKRNVVVKHFTEGPFDKLLFVDSDIKFTTHDLRALVDSGKDIVGARAYGYSEERDETFPNWQPISESPKETGLEECSHIGMDFTLLSRHALEVLGVRPAEGWPFGYGTIGDLYAATEDVLFCHRAREAGLSVFVNLDARVYHAKTRLV